MTHCGGLFQIIFRGIMRSMDDDRISWHPAFLRVLQLEFEAYLDVLSFEAEHKLTSDPLSIDVLIIKKDKEAVIDNPIARIFKSRNIFEYKSPTDRLTIDQFYKGLVYVFLYISQERLDITDISLSMAVTQDPKQVLKHIREVWRYEITERESGIYEIRGFLFPIQIIENTKISKRTNAFLSILNNDLDRDGVDFVLTEAQKPHKVDISAFVDVIVRANPDSLEEVLQMGNRTLEQVLEKAGLAARWEERKAKEIAQNLIQEGWDSKKIAEMTGLDLATVRSLYETAQT